jgi:predicted nuclease of predicted toxin-antitoxin system
VKFLVDAQLPRRLAAALNEFGHEATHTVNFTTGNRTPDETIIARADAEQRIVVTKDSDFVTSFLLRGEPRQLLLISTGNISNDELLRIVSANLRALEAAFAQYRFVELTRFTLTIHA